MFYQYDQVEAVSGDFSHHQLGRDLGERFSRQISDNIADYERFLTARAISAETRQEVIDRIRGNLRTWAPHMLEEMQGIAAGAGCQLEDIIALNSRTELLAAAPPAGEGECSTAVLLPQDGSAPRTVQTWDWIEDLNKDMLIRRYPTPSGRTVTTFAEFGQLAKIGVNSEGLGNHFNILNHQTDGQGSGVPVHLVAKRILDEASTVEEAVAIAEAANLEASTVITVVADGQAGPQAACVELSPQGTAALHAEVGRPLVHTNHFVDPQLAAGEQPNTLSTTHDRYQCAADHGEVVMSIADDLERARQFTATDFPVDVKPDLSKPWFQQIRTKATVVVDVVNSQLHCCPGSASRISEEEWITYPA